jgi:hypothetical protein
VYSATEDVVELGENPVDDSPDLAERMVGPRASACPSS